MESSTVHGLIVRKLCPLVVGVWCLCSSSVAQPVVSAGLPEASNRLSSELLLSIDEAVELDLQRSFRVNRKVRSAEMARLRADIAAAPAKPRIDTDLGMQEALRSATFYQNPYRKGKSDPYATTQVSLNAVVSMPIDISGNIARQQRQAQLSLTSATINAEQSAGYQCRHPGHLCGCFAGARRSGRCRGHGG